MEIKTIHPQEKNVNGHISILEAGFNRFKIQIILKQCEDKEFECSINNRSKYDEKDLDTGVVDNILRKYISKVKVGFFFRIKRPPI